MSLSGVSGSLLTTVASNDLSAAGLELDAPSSWIFYLAFGVLATIMIIIGTAAVKEVFESDAFYFSCIIFLVFGVFGLALLSNWLDNPEPHLEDIEDHYSVSSLTLLDDKFGVNRLFAEDPDDTDTLHPVSFEHSGGDGGIGFLSRVNEGEDTWALLVDANMKEESGDLVEFSESPDNDEEDS